MVLVFGRIPTWIKLGFASAGVLLFMILFFQASLKCCGASTSIIATDVSSVPSAIGRSVEVPMRGKFSFFGLPTIISRLLITGGGQTTTLSSKVREDMEDQLSRSDHVNYMDVQSEQEAKLLNVIRSPSSAILLSESVFRLLCSSNILHEPLKDFGDVSPEERIGLAELSGRIKALQKALKKSTAHLLLGAFIGELHGGSFQVAQCAHKLNIDLLVTHHLFRSETLSLASVLLAFQRPIRMMWMPMHMGFTTMMPTVMPMHKRSYDVFLGDPHHQRAFAHRLGDAFKSQHVMSYVTCDEIECIGVRGGGARVFHLGESSSSNMIKLLGQCRMAIAQNQDVETSMVQASFEGAVPVLGKMPLDSRFIFEEEDMIVFKESDTDAQILNKLAEFAKDNEILDEKVKRMRLKVESISLDVYTDHMVQAIRDGGNSVLPPFLPTKSPSGNLTDSEASVQTELSDVITKLASLS